MADELWSEEEWLAAMSTADINDLPDSDFAYIEPGGKKDAEGKTVPRSLRHYPVHDVAHTRNALARAAAAIKAGGDAAAIAKKAMPKILSAAKKFGIEVSDEQKAAAKKCSTCDGTGKIMDGNRKCPDCGGTGEMESKAAGDNCNRCEGMGTINLDGETVECPTCGGSGDGTNNADDEQKSKIHARALRAEMRNVPETRISPRREFELREVPNGTGGTNLRFTGFASVTEAEYEMEDWLGPWVESVSRGAFAKTLSDGADVAFLLNHQGMTLARTKSGTLKLSEYTEGVRSPIFGVTGLYSEAMLDPQNPHVQAMRSALERQDLDEMSFAFRVTRQDWDDPERRVIQEVSLSQGDVSLVNFGANPTTGGTVAIRQKLLGRSDGVSAERMAAILKNSALFRELRAGKTLSAATLKGLQPALDALHTADDVDIPAIVRSLQDIDSAVDEGLASLSDVMGTKNPDGDPADLEPELGPPDKKGLIIEPDLSAMRAAIALERARGKDVA